MNDDRPSPATRVAIQPHADAFTLRTARHSDAAALAALAAATFREAFAAGCAAEDMDAHCASSFTEAIQLGEIADPDRLTLVAETDGILIGYTQARWMRSIACVAADRPAELHRIYVSSGWHGRGVTPGLMRLVLAAASRNGCDRIWLSVWERNPRAIAFYRRFGFEQAGEQRFMVGSDAQRDLIMAASLPGP